MKRPARPGGIRVCVIGCGKMGYHHLKGLGEAGMTVAAAVDPEPERLKMAEAECPGVAVYGSVRAMLKGADVDLAVVVTPHNTHASIALQCLRAGVNVVTEKPFAITTAECDRMIAAARKRRLLVTAFHNRHWDGCILRAAEKIRAGAIGDVYRVEVHVGGQAWPGDAWRSSKSMSGGILYDWGVHLLDYALQIVDSDMVEVSGYARTGHLAKTISWKRDAAEDEAMAVVRFRSGAWLTLSASNIDRSRRARAVQAVGTKGTYTFDLKTWTLITAKGTEAEAESGENPPSEGWRFYRNVADHLTRGAPLVITPEWARRPIHILDLADRSARKGAAIKAKYK